MQSRRKRIIWLQVQQNKASLSTTAGGRRGDDNVFAVNQAYQLHAIDFRRYSSGVYYVVLRDSNGKKVKTGEVLIR